MNTLVYFEPAKMDSNNLYYVKQEILGWFYWGHDIEPIYFGFKGEILFEFVFDKKLIIADADKAFCAATNNKKVPSNIICYCKEFPAGGWDK